MFSRVFALVLAGFVTSPAFSDDTIPEGHECTPKKYRIQGSSMAPLILNGDHVHIQPKACMDDIQKGDVILFKSGASKIPLIKRVYALEGEPIEFKPTRGGFHLYVDGKRLENSAGRIYHFTERRTNMIRLYGDTVPKNTYLVFGDKTGGTLDSTRVGYVNIQDILGKMVGGESKREVEFDSNP